MRAPVCFVLAASALVAACGGELGVTGDAGSDAAATGNDATAGPARDAGFDAAPPVGRDASTDAAVEHIDVTDASDATDAGDAADSAEAWDANPSGCPTSYGGANGSCTAPGLSCVYPEGTCVCHAPCVGGCLPVTCAQLGIQCGPAGDGCGALLLCGGCPPFQTCGGGGQYGHCGGDAGPPDACVPKTCADVGAQCGVVPDGCGGQIDCGICYGWDCTPAMTGCPDSEPTSGAPCSTPSGQRCTYARWAMACCMATYGCFGGSWTMTQLVCPQ